MRIAPSFIKTIINPTQKSLQEFVRSLHTTYQNFSEAFNGRVSYGDGTNTENIDGSWASLTTPTPAGTNFTVTHGLNRTPVGVHVMQKNAFCDVLIVSSTSTTITLQASAAGVVIKLFIFLLFLCLIPFSSSAQGVRHVNIAQGQVKLAGSSGFSGNVSTPLAGATITVCTGSTLPVAGSTCTGLASIYVDIGLTGLLSNPTNSDSGGNYSFYAVGGVPYVVSVSAVGFTTFSYVWSAPLSGTSPTLTGTTTVVNLTVNGTGTFTGATTTCILNGMYVVGTSCYPTIQSAVNAATLALTGVFIPCTYTGTDTFSNTSNIPVVACGSSLPDPFTGVGLRVNAGVSGMYGTARPAKDSGGVNVPLGGDVGLVGAGPADLHLVGELLSATSTTSVPGAGTQNVTITTPCNYGTGCNANYFYTAAFVDVNRFQSDYEHATINSIPNSNTLNITFGRAHTQPFTIEQEGSILVNNRTAFLLSDTTSGAFSNYTLGFANTGTASGASREYIMGHASSGVNYFKSGLNGNHLPRWYGEHGNGSNPALVIFGSDAGACIGTTVPANCPPGAGTSGIIAMSTNETDDPNGTAAKIIFDPNTGKTSIGAGVVAIGALPGLSGTGACSATSTQLGGSWSGSFKCTGTTGAATVTITPGITAPNGWNCSSTTDETTTADTLKQSSHTTTSCTLTAAAIASGDVIIFSAFPY